MKKRSHVARPLGSNPLPSGVPDEAPDPLSAPAFKTPKVVRPAETDGLATRFVLPGGNRPD